MTERDKAVQKKRWDTNTWLINILALLLLIALIYIPYSYTRHPSRLYNVPDEVVLNAIYEYENNITDETDPCSTKVNSDAYAAARAIGYSHASYTARQGCAKEDSDRSGEYWIVRTNFVKGFCSIREDLDNRI